MKRSELKEIIKETLKEQNEDGTISNNEEDEKASLLGNVEAEFDVLLEKAYSKAEEIGGPFRSPSIKKEIRLLIKKKLEESRSV